MDKYASIARVPRASTTANTDSLRNQDSAPVSDSVPLRVLDLYRLIRDGSKATFMRSKPYRLCLRAPPSRWAWDVDMGCGHELPLTQATPHLVSHRNRKYYEYNDAESEAIWCYSCSYEGKPQ